MSLGCFCCMYMQSITCVLHSFLDLLTIFMVNRPTVHLISCMRLFFSSALLFIKFQWMVVVWHPLYRSQKILYWVLTHKCYKSIKKSTNKWQLISLLSLVFKKNGKEMNIHLEFYWKIRAISYSWSVFCFSWIFCRSFALSICVFFFHMFSSIVWD